MSFPSSPPALPAIVARFAVGRPVRAVWVNELGGVTFRVDSGMGAGCEFIKVARRGTADFANEARRLRWAAPYLAVPRVPGGVRQEGFEPCCGAHDLDRPGSGRVA